jgi:hypothetical protein
MYSGAIMKARVLSTGNVLLPPGRVVYPNLVTPGLPKGRTDETDRQWSAGVLLPANADLAVLETEIARVVKEAKLPKNARTGIIETEDVEKLARYAAEFPRLVRTSRRAYTRTGAPMGPPGVVFADGKTKVEPDQERDQCYGGRWVRITVQPFAYDASGNRGVSLGLVNAQLLAHDERMGGARPSAADEFDAVDVDEDDTRRFATAADVDDEMFS